MAPAAQAQSYWYWCWNYSHGDWDYCWWDGGISQESDQESDAGEITQTFTISKTP
jgi:hypothetical protein